MRHVTIESLLELHFVGRPRLSPDGKRVAFTVQRADAVADRYKSDLYLLEESGQYRRLTQWEDVQDCLWTAEGELLFSSRHGLEPEVEGTQIYCWDWGSDRPSLDCLIPGPAAQLLWAGKETLLFAATSRNEAEHALQREIEAAGEGRVDVFDELPFWSNDQGVTNRKRRGLYRFDRASGKSARLTDQWFDVEQTAVSDDGEMILYSGCGYRGNRPASSEIRLCRTDGCDDRRLVEAGAYDFIFLTLWGDEGVMFAVPDSELHQKMDGDFFRIDLKTGKVSLLTAYGKGAARGGGVTTDARLGTLTTGVVDGDSLYFTSDLAGSSILCRLDRDGTITEGLTGTGSCDSFDVKKGRLVLCGMYGNRPGELCEQGKQLTHFNDDYFSRYTVSHPEACHFADEDGIEIEGWCLRPADYQPGKKYPAVLEIHGGPRAMYGPVFHHEMQALAGNGYFVLFCNPRGSDGYGDSFAYLDDQYGQIDYRNLMTFVDRMLEKYPDIDPKRLGVAGGSYGGYMTNWIIGHTNRFRAAASQRSTSDWVAFTFTGDMSTTYDPLHVKHLESDRVARAWELSPLKYAPQVQTPTLFIQADEDYRCFMCDAIMMYSALRVHGVEARLCLFRGENHNLSRTGRPKARIRRLKEIAAWFDRWLKKEG